MTDFLFVTYDAVLWFVAFLFAGSLLFCLALGHLLRQSRINCDRLHAELAGHVDEVTALRQERGNVRAIAEAWETVSWDAWQYIESHDWTEN